MSGPDEYVYAPSGIPSDALESVLEELAQNVCSSKCSGISIHIEIWDSAIIPIVCSHSSLVSSGVNARCL